MTRIAMRRPILARFTTEMGTKMHTKFKSLDACSLSDVRARSPEFQRLRLSSWGYSAALRFFKNPVIGREHPGRDRRLSGVRRDEDGWNKGPESEAEMNGWCLRQDPDQGAARSAERSASTLLLDPHRC